MQTLNDLAQGESAIIAKVKGRGAFRRRIMEMGFVTGKKVSVVRRAPLQDPIEFSLMGYNVSLRGSEARLIEVVAYTGQQDFHQVLQKEPPENELSTHRAAFVNGQKHQGYTINIALVGNPNAGKTTVFNFFSGLRERVGNYSGVTVGAKEARFQHKGYTFNITDLPGTYSISAYSPEELYVRNHIFKNLPDVVVNITDSTNLERNLYLTTQLIDMDIRVVMALNMYDELERKGDCLDTTMLGQLIGIPVIPTVAPKGKGMQELLDKIIEVYEDREPTIRHIHINYGPVIEKGIKAIQEKIKIPANVNITDQISSRFISIKLLERDREELARVQTCANSDEIVASAQSEIKKIEALTGDSAETAITDAKYGFIAGALRETFSTGIITRKQLTQTIDTVLTHKYAGLPVFGLFMWLMFEGTFTLGQYPVGWIESGVAWLSALMVNLMNPGMFRDLLVDGIIGGIGGVIVFLPNIVILYLFIAMMEDTGYMARAVFITDKLMHRIGLHGKSFIPMMMGFGCTVPAIMATRTLENRTDRMVTMLITPFMSCSARLPVYVLLLSAFFTNYSGTILFFIYLFGIMVAIAVALLLKKTLFKGQQLPFVMELPPYRIPTFKAIIIHMWDRAAQYVKKIAGVILVAAIIIWALGYFPVNSLAEEEFVRQTDSIAKVFEQQTNILTDPLLRTKTEKIRDSILFAHEEHFLAKRQEASYIGRIGKFVEPVMSPLGFDWKMSVSILAGTPGKEIVVSTMAVLYGADKVHGDDNNSTLIRQLHNEEYRNGPRQGQKVFSPRVALSFMIFILLYFPCMSTVAVIAHEAGSWKWGAFVIVYTTSLAWLASWIVYQAGGLFL
jgi:ferrous iron transport protein B